MATSMPILGTTGSLLVQAPVLRSIVAIRGVDTDKPLDVLEARQRATHKRIKPGLIRIVHGAVHCGEWGELYACPDAVAHVSIVIKLSTVDRKPVFLIDRLADMPRDDTHWIMEVSFFGSEPPNPISLKIKLQGEGLGYCYCCNRPTPGHTATETKRQKHLYQWPNESA